MTLTCITGRSGSGKTTRCMEIIRRARQTGGRILMLVPEQDTVQAELQLTRALNLQVMWDVEVLSPTRFARRVQEMTAGSARVWLSDAGRAMALRGAMLRLRDGLKYFRSGSQGAADLMGDFLVELKRNEADAMSLRLAADRMPVSSALAQKLYDLAAIYEAYDEHMAGKYIDGEDALQRCAQQIMQCEELRDVTVVADGFDVLPRATLRMLAALGRQCENVYVTFSVCESGATDAALYEQPQLSLNTLYEMCAEYGVTVERENLPARALENAEMDHLARNLFANRAKKYEKAPENIHIVQMRDPYMEAERAAGYLFEKCRREGWHYRDMAVVVGDMDTYGERLKQAFARRGMRVYIDHAATADTHPAAQYLLAALAGAARYYRMDDMLRCLKSGYCGISLREADRLELYAMEHGLEGRLWELPAETEEETQEGARSMEELRACFASPVIRMRQGGLTRTVREFAESVVQLMEEVHLADQLAAEYRKSEEAGDLVRMQVLIQMQDAVNSVLDQAVELCGGEEVHMEEFIKLFRAGLEAVTLGSIPMSPDAVYVGQITRFKGRNIKLLYVVGANADVIPSRKQDSGMLSESEKVALRDAAQEAGAQVRVSLLSNRTAVERFAIFGALISAKEELVLSWSSVDPRGVAKRESPLLIRLREKVFPLLKEEGGATGDRYVYAGAKASMREVLTAGLRAQMSGAVADEALPALAAAYRAADPMDYEALMASLENDIAQQEIDDETAQELYRHWKKQRIYGVEEMVASISQLETFALCPFAHFLRFGLRPRELKEPEMDARDRGTMEHKAVELFVGRLMQMGGEISDEEAEKLMDEVLQPLFDEDADKRRRHSGLVKAGHSRIRRTMQRIGRLLALQQRLSDFETSAEEIAFVPGDLPPLELRDGQRVHLEGKIDRVDVKTLTSGEYARVVDYKTGNNELRLEDVYYGLRLQLFLYLDAVLTMRGAKPAGVFYQKLGDAAVRLDGERISEKTEDKRNKKLRLSGYILEEENVIRSMCADPEWMEQVLPLTPKRSKGAVLPGQFTDASKENMLSEEQFDLLRRHTRRKLTQLAQGIMDGEAKVSPAQTKGIEACKYCRYRSVCGFDESLPGCARRELKMESTEVLETIKKEDA